MGDMRPTPVDPGSGSPFLTKAAGDAAYIALGGPFPLRGRDFPGIAGLATAQAVAATVVASATTSAVTGYTVYQDSGRFTYSGSLMAYKTTFPDNQYYWPMAATTTNNTAAQTVLPPFRVSFFTDAPTFEIIAKGNGAAFRVLIDGQYITAGGGATRTLANDGQLYYTGVTVGGSRAMHRVDVDFPTTGAFGGVKIGTTDTLQAAPRKRPRVIVFGDSFTEGSNATASYSNFVWTLAQFCGWEPWASGLGGTGYLAGSSTLRTRIADVTAANPDVVIIAAGINDRGTYTSAAIGTEAATLYAALQTALPNVKLIVVSPFWRNGVKTFPSDLIGARDAIKTAALAAGAMFLDVLEQPLTATFSTTLSAAITAGATTTTTPARYSTSGAANGANYVVEVGTGTANVERVEVASWTGGGPFTLTPKQAFGNSHSSGETVRIVGSPLWTGTGKVGTTTGDGNSDFVVSSDGTHPTQEGHDMIAMALFQQLVAQLPA